jgi:hypothetical protein
MRVFIINKMVKKISVTAPKQTVAKKIPEKAIKKISKNAKE